MTTVTLPYPGDYDKLQDYMKAVKAHLTDWKWLHRDSEFKSPADQWKFHKELMGATQ